MSTRRGFITAVAASSVLPVAAAIAAPSNATELPPVRDASGRWPKDLFPPGQHPTDANGPSTPESDDEELITVCAEFDAIEAHINAHYSGGALEIKDDEERDIAILPMQEAQEPLLDRIVALRATTLDGFMARARTLAGWDVEATRKIGEDNYLNERMLAALLRDMVGKARS